MVVAALLAAELLAAGAWLTWDNLADVWAGNALGDRLRASEVASEALLSTLVDAETGQRGFLLTGDPAYLEPYDAARGRLDAALARLAPPLAADGERAARLRALTGAKMAELSGTIETHRAGRAEAAVEAVRAGNGKRTMDAIRAETESLRAANEAELAAARARGGSAWRWAAPLGLAAAAGALLGGAALARGRGRDRAPDAAASARARRFARAFGLVPGLLRDLGGRITHWTRGNQRLYGFRPEEALGRNSHELLRTRFPRPLPEIEAELRRDGQWQGELAHRRRDGSEVVVAAHWALHPGAAAAGEAGDAVVEVNTDITPLKRAEAALRESEARLRTATDNARVGLVVVDGEHRYRFANRAYAEILGLPTHDIVGQRVADVLAPVYGAQIRPRLDRAFRGERVEYELTKPGPPPGGGDGHFAVTYEPGRAEDGGPIVAVVITDVTERTRAARALAENEGMLRLALDASDLGAWRWEAGGGGQDLDWDARCKAQFGLAPDAAVTYAAWAGAVLPEDRARVEAGVARALDPADPDDDWACEYRAARPDGRVAWLAAKGRAVFEPDPVAPAGRRAVRILGTMADITESRRAEQERRRIGALLRAIGEATPDLIFAKDRDSRMLYANPAMLALLGKPAGELLGRSDAEWHHDPAEAEAFMAVDRRVAEGGRAEVAEETFTAPGGPTRVFLSTKAPMRDAAGAVVGIVGVTRDITEAKRAGRHRELLVNELNHRVKNTLAAVQSIAVQTMRGNNGGPAALDTFEDRLIALSHAHDLLTRESWDGAPLREVAERALAPFGPAEGRAGRIGIAGPEVRLGPKAAIALALAFHELATNAAKYGALSGDRGRVDVEWELAAAPGGEAGGERLRLRWRESGGPPVRPPERKGFGSRLIQGGLAAELGGRVALRFEPAGLNCDMDLPAAAGGDAGERTLDR